MDVQAFAREDPRSGFLGTLPDRAAEELLAGAIRITVPAGGLVYREGEAPRVIVVMEGLLRAFLRSAEGRQLTVRYLHQGDVAGLAPVLGGPGLTTVQAMTTSSVEALRVDRLRRLLGSDPEVARACAEEVTRQLSEALGQLSERAFLTVRRRIVRHLLDLAVVDRGRLVVYASQQDLADAVGSVREVVTRTLRGLRRQGLVRTRRDEIVLLDPVGLTRELAAG
ncbi:MAG TPA: Crp/Fnr family transcriptional regulator [Actinomycetota bacterium]|nr:Crp/Fnr family transcriptional regulator [Actinomycetota bacterium]